MSRGFVCALLGIAMTLFAWFGPWAWPAWPALAAIDLVFGSNTAFSELSIGVRAATVVMLIIVNVFFWTMAGWIAAQSFHALRARVASRTDPHRRTPRRRWDGLGLPRL